MSGSGDPFVSVIIPVFNDGEQLRLCLAALAEQTYERSHFEVIVVDNGSAARDCIKNLVASYAGTLFAEEAIVGPYAARNRGLTLARGEIIAFTDADCRPDPDWIEHGVSHLLQRADCGLVAGKVEVLPEDVEKPSLIEAYQMVIGFPQEDHLKTFQGAATANVWTRRAVIDRVGPFDATLKSYGDFEWGSRVFRAGYGQMYAADVVVQHPARSTWTALRQRTERDAGGVYDHTMQLERSWFRRNSDFLRLVSGDLVPPVNFAITALRHPQVGSLRQRLGLPLVLLALRYISAREKLRLRLGGISKRA